MAPARADAAAPVARTEKARLQAARGARRGWMGPDVGKGANGIVGAVLWRRGHGNDPQHAGLEHGVADVGSRPGCDVLALLPMEDRPHSLEHRDSDKVLPFRAPAPSFEALEKEPKAGGQRGFETRRKYSVPSRS